MHYCCLDRNLLQLCSKISHFILFSFHFHNLSSNSCFKFQMGARIHQFLYILFIQFWFSTAQNDDGAILRALKDSWQNTPPNWEDNPDPCNGWDGIRCKDSRIISITLTSMGLSGTLSGDIGQLTELQILDLSYNPLTGSLTPQIGNLNKLTNLLLVDCNFTGPLPETLGSLENLVFMSLNLNHFTGSIPPSIGNITSLYWLDLADNQLTGSIPVSSRTTPGLDMLTNARHFHVGGNKLSGAIPEQLFHPNMKLIHLLFENNQLTGPIPDTLGLVTSLEVVRLDRNSLTGNVPSNINSLTGLFELFLSNNLLTGPVPDLTGLDALNYLFNKLNGTLDIGSSQSSQLQQVNLQDNQIEEFRQRDQNNIAVILVGNPICMESGHTGGFCSIPVNTDTPYSTPPNGCTPSSCNSGQVSSPASCRCAYPYIGNLVFRAPSFSDLENSAIYEALRSQMNDYFLRTELPVETVSLRNPRKSLEGYLEITLQVFPFADNHRFNRTGILDVGFSLSNQTFKPNKTFGTYFFTAEKYDFTEGASGGKSSNTGVIIGSVVGGCVLVALLVLAGIYALRQKGSSERTPHESSPFALWDENNGSGAVPQLKGTKAFSYQELRKYTNNFSESNNIGTGGYGMVYKGSLPNGQLVAIKRSTRGSTQGGLEFKTEIELLSRVHHKNLVSLIGFCFDQGEQMLVYEFIVNGTLKDTLSGNF
ncbi:hypothetical protein M8C21_014574 [Ambrosia artemisiifolia]|uniref:non-specific serine/threonine protein kinase n=1 Tax=Ambrosia artemisiifolia TaxID=4212 RepID=A0AAD5CAV4_AMBAR|nr:hypothetical protein M8C21_014574 [Ambrosia artemisiifolia]